MFDKIKGLMNGADSQSSRCAWRYPENLSLFFFGEEARMPNFLSLRARLEDLYLSNSYKKIHCCELF